MQPVHPFRPRDSATSCAVSATRSAIRSLSPSAMNAAHRAKNLSGCHRSVASRYAAFRSAAVGLRPSDRGVCRSGNGMSLCEKPRSRAREAWPPSAARVGEALPAASSCSWPPSPRPQTLPTPAAGLPRRSRAGGCASASRARSTPGRCGARARSGAGPRPASCACPRGSGSPGPATACLRARARVRRRGAGRARGGRGALSRLDWVCAFRMLLASCSYCRRMSRRWSVPLITSSRSLCARACDSNAARPRPRLLRSRPVGAAKLGVRGDGCGEVLRCDRDGDGIRVALRR